MHEDLAIAVLLLVTSLLGLIDAFYFNRVLRPRRPTRFIVVFTVFTVLLAMTLNIASRIWELPVTGIYLISAVGYTLRVLVLYALTKAKIGHVLFAFVSIQTGFAFVEALIDYFGLLTGVAIYGKDYFIEVQAYAQLENIVLDTRTTLYFAAILLFTLLLYSLLIYLLYFAWVKFVRPLSYERLKLLVWVPISHVFVELSMNLYLGDADLELVIYFLTSSTVVFGVPMHIYFMSDALFVMFAGVTIMVFYILWKLRENEELLHIRQLIRNQLSAQTRQYEQLSRQEQATRNLQHDVKNIQAAALEMAKDGDIPGAVQLLKQALRRLE